MLVQAADAQIFFPTYPLFPLSLFASRRHRALTTRSTISTSSSDLDGASVEHIAWHPTEPRVYGEVAA